MKAMIYAAGLGTRLRPLTNFKPKALVEIKGITLLELTIARLKTAGFDEIIINVHHFAEQVKEFLKQKNNFNIHVEISEESEQLLDTGGGLKKASWFFDGNKAFLVYNVDVISDIDLKYLYNTAEQNHAIATLAVRERKTSRYLLFDDELNLCGWKNTKTGETKISKGELAGLLPYAFSGIQIINPAIFDLINESGKFSMIDLYLRLAADNNIKAFMHNDGYWLDVGKPESLDEAGKIINRD
jgi:NDP-sugar pyrophosphorylase family protein